MADLREQSERLLGADSTASDSEPGQIAYNVIPQIDRFLESGYTLEEQKMRQETQKIMHAPSIQVSATCVRVPVYISHGAAVHLEFERPMEASQARELLAAMPGVTVMDDPYSGRCPGTSLAKMTCSLAGFAKTCPTPTGWPCGSFPTTSAKGPR